MRFTALDPLHDIAGRPVPVRAEPPRKNTHPVGKGSYGARPRIAFLNIMRAARNLLNMVVMVLRASRFVRSTAALVVGLLLAASSVSVAGRQAASDQRQCECHQCSQTALTCCCDSEHGGSSAPTAPPSSPVQVSGPGPSAHAVAAPPVLHTHEVTASSLRLYSPPHGIRFVEFPVLFSTFLI